MLIGPFILEFGTVYFTKHLYYIIIYWTLDWTLYAWIIICKLYTLDVLIMDIFNWTLSVGSINRFEHFKILYILH